MLQTNRIVSIDGLLDVKIFLLSANAQIPNVEGLELNGAYIPQWGHVIVRVRGDSAVGPESALLHELLAHRVPWLTTRDPNAGHSEYWHEYELAISGRVREALK